MDAFWCRVQRYAYGLNRSGIHQLADCIEKISITLMTEGLL
jgi:hypothetical protein